LGTERLRVVDLDPRADQPFSDPANRVWLACNGEIYNAPDLRRRFADYPFRSRSDVETIIPLYLARGVQGLADLLGMFAIALWDEAAQTLLLARDPAGEKPLFYATVEGAVAFASEIQALIGYPGMSRRLDQQALAAFTTLGYVPQPRTMFERVRTVPAGGALVLGPEGCRPFTYWDPTPVRPVERPPRAAEQLRDLLGAAVRRQLTADVPVGVFTSGGLDSSLIAALATEALGRDRIHTFTARFTAPTYDESRFARSLARHLGTRHVDVTVDHAELAEAWEAVATRVAEPIADPAVLPTLLLARRARESVTVVLGGEGADELFGGYPTYLGHALAPHFTRLPDAVGRVAARVIAALPDSDAKVPVSALLKRFAAHARQPWRQRHLAWFGTGIDPAALRVEPLSPADWPETRESDPVLAQAMLLDYRTYLRDQLLVKLDRATMQVGLESRSPYLDPDVTRFALSLHPDLKVSGLATKRLLKQAARGCLPAAIVGRRKRGLSVPIATWLRGGLRPEVDRLLDPERLRRQGVVSDVYVSGLWAEHRSGRRNHARALWTLIVLQRWLERWAPEVTG
jgi:asparagine synthase (glutamine-hydrolysing)